MRKHKIIVLTILIIFIAVPVVSFAISFPTNRPIGGRVITTPIDTAAAIVCAAAYGPFSVLPVNIAVPGPFFIQNIKAGIPARDKHFLALYNAVPDFSTCHNPETGAPIPAFKIKIYGVSR
jgi:hypothetical protein